MAAVKTELDTWLKFPIHYEDALSLLAQLQDQSSLKQYIERVAAVQILSPAQVAEDLEQYRAQQKRNDRARKRAQEPYGAPSLAHSYEAAPAHSYEAVPSHPYGAPPPSHPYGAPPPSHPYGAPPPSHPYGAPPPSHPYGAPPPSHPYGASPPSHPYGAPPPSHPYGAPPPSHPYGAPSYPYGAQAYGVQAQAQSSEPYYAPNALAKRCIYCHQVGLSQRESSRLTGSAWVVFAICLLIFFPLALIPLLTMRERIVREYCNHCRRVQDID